MFNIRLPFRGQVRYPSKRNAYSSRMKVLANERAYELAREVVAEHGPLEDEIKVGCTVRALEEANPYLSATMIWNIAVKLNKDREQ